MTFGRGGAHLYHSRTKAISDAVQTKHRKNEKHSSANPHCACAPRVNESVEYFGRVVDAKGIHISRRKLQAVLDAPEPKNIHKLFGDDKLLFSVHTGSVNPAKNTLQSAQGSVAVVRRIPRSTGGSQEAANRFPGFSAL